VWVHVTRACACWLATLWAAYAAGRLPARVPVPVREGAQAPPREGVEAPPVRVSV